MTQHHTHAAQHTIIVQSRAAMALTNAIQYISLVYDMRQIVGKRLSSPMTSLLSSIVVVIRIYMYV